MTTNLDQDVQNVIAVLNKELTDLEPLREGCAEEWRTKGTFTLPSGNIVNIRRASKEDVFELTNFIFQTNKSKKRTFEFLEISKEEKVAYADLQGFESDEWLEDLKKRWCYLDLREKEIEIEKKLDKANKLLSEDAKKRIELDKISK